MTMFLITAIHLSCLGQIESGNIDIAIGGAGEVSRYQIMPEVWHNASTYPIRYATDPTVSKDVALIIWRGRVNAFCKAQGRSPTLQELYLLWHRPSRAMNPKPFEEERAQRFANLCVRKQ